MENFAELLNQFIKQSGINDSELARAIGVSRQTIFRWRGGQTTRPRHREDVLALAKKLRLTDAEKDKLLLAAGFRPINQEPAKEKAEKEDKGKAETVPTEKAKPVPQIWGRIAVAIIIILSIGLIYWGLKSFTNTPLKNNPPLAIPLLDQNPAQNSNQTNETIILVTHFANYGSSQVGYNVAGRIAEALNDEIKQSDLQGIQVLIWPSEIGSEASALEAGRESAATLVIYGEYDVGRVVVQFAQPENVINFGEPAIQHSLESIQALSAHINNHIPEEVRSLALLTLGQIYLAQEEADQARVLLLQARSNLEQNGEQDLQTWAVLNFYLGLAYQSSQPANLDQAIIAYSAAIEARPKLIAPYTNRISAYQSRQEPGDLEQALADAHFVVTASPNSGSAHNNYGAILTSLGSSENLRHAIESFDQAILLAPDDPIAYFNRANIQFQLGATMESISPDLEQAIELNPTYGSALNLYCWGHNLEGSPEKALPYCEKAVEASDGKPLFRDSRALAHAQLGDFSAAIADLEAYTTWLTEQTPNATRQQKLKIRQGWEL